MGYNLGYFTVICLGGLRKTTKCQVRIAGLRSEICTRCLLNTKEKCYTTAIRKVTSSELLAKQIMRK
jgi:hypothetical protein